MTFDAAKGTEQPAVRTADRRLQTGTAAAGVLFDTLRLLRVTRCLLFVPGVAGLAGRFVSPAPADHQPPVAVGS
ncbi:hypothetical protein J0H58_11315 [bacterium]|nr:hypothetical protein [bacterium]